MTQEEKQLLIKDLCSRVPYGVMCARLSSKRKGDVFGSPLKLIGIHPSRRYMLEFDNGEYMPKEYMLDDVKPYLRPMSSMTADEEERWGEFMVPTSFFDYENNGLKAAVFWDELCYAIDWLIAHHFDIPRWNESENTYKTMIEMELAIEAPEGMYNIKELI